MKIVCAAILIHDGKEHPHQPVNIDKGMVVCGFRHCNCITTASLLDEGYFKDKEVTQGFLTDENTFVNRIEGGEIAFAAGQIKKLTTCLFSEDLY